MELELHDILKLRKAALLHAPEERKAEIQADITRIRTAIATENEMRKSTVPTSGCGAAAAAERRDARIIVDEAQWKFEAERRTAAIPAETGSNLLDINKMTRVEKEQLIQAWRDGKCRIEGNVVLVDIE